MISFDIWIPKFWITGESGDYNLPDDTTTAMIVIPFEPLTITISQQSQSQSSSLQEKIRNFRTWGSEVLNSSTQQSSCASFCAEISPIFPIAPYAGLNESFGEKEWRFERLNELTLGAFVWATEARVQWFGSSSTQACGRIGIGRCGTATLWHVTTFLFSTYRTERLEGLTERLSALVGLSSCRDTCEVENSGGVHFLFIFSIFPGKHSGVVKLFTSIDMDVTYKTWMKSQVLICKYVRSCNIVPTVDYVAIEWFHSLKIGESIVQYSFIKNYILISKSPSQKALVDA